MNVSIDCSMSRKFRIAPTPSGFLHAGNGAAFVLTALLARSFNAPLLLRIDDMDSERKRSAYLNDIFYTLEWLGIEWQEGPNGPDDFEAKWSQRHRMPLYTEMLEELSSLNTVYACQCSRAAVASGTACTCHLPKNSVTPGIAWKIRIPPSTGIGFTDLLAGSLSIPLADEPAPVIRKKDLLPSYQVCSLADDVFFGVTDVVRGIDLLHSTAIQLYLAEVTGRLSFIENRFYHHPLLTDQHGRKLSKSADDESIQSIRQRQVTPVSIYQIAADWLQIKTQASAFEELYKASVEEIKQRFT